MQTNNDTPLSTGTMFGYGIGQTGGQILRDVPSLFLPFYLMTTLGVNPSLAGIVIFIPKLWVMICDPLMGVISDKTDTPWGRRRPFILVSGVLSALTFWFLFNPPALESEFARALYVCVLFAVMSTAYSMFSVPHLTMAAEMTDDSKQRTTVMAWRMIGLGLGLLVSTSMAPFLIEYFGYGPAGYNGMSWVVAIIIFITITACFFGTAKAPSRPSSTELPAITEQFLLAFKNKPFFILLSANFIQLVGQACAYSAMMFFIYYYMGMNLSDMSQLMLIMVIALFTCQPIWVAIAARLGKKYTYYLALVLNVVTMLSWLLVRSPDDIFIGYLVAASLGITGSGYALMSTSMLPDTMDHDRRLTGTNREGVFAGIWSASDKVAFALAPLITGVVLDAFGFVSTQDLANTPQSDMAITGIILTYTVIPAALIAASIVVLKLYRLETDNVK